MHARGHDPYVHFCPRESSEAIALFLLELETLKSRLFLHSIVLHSISMRMMFYTGKGLENKGNEMFAKWTGQKEIGGLFFFKARGKQDNRL